MTKRINLNTVDADLRQRLTAVYEEVMWLAARPGNTPSMARAWFTHVAAERYKRQIRQFTGKVSKNAVRDPEATLRLEHQARIQSKLTTLVETHLKYKRPRPRAFVRFVLEAEKVHIVTFEENYLAMQNDGNYRRAGIKLVAWRDVPKKKRRCCGRRCCTAEWRMRTTSPPVRWGWGTGTSCAANSTSRTLWVRRNPNVTADAAIGHDRT
jgi:hypothetical protein